VRRLNSVPQRGDQFRDGLAKGTLLLARKARELAGKARLKIESGTHQSGC
jgi:hypothetical protein